MRPDAVFDKSKPISGGIPHCFPQVCGEYGERGCMVSVELMHMCSSQLQLLQSAGLCEFRGWCAAPVFGLTRRGDKQVCAADLYINDPAVTNNRSSSSHSIHNPDLLALSNVCCPQFGPGKIQQHGFDCNQKLHLHQPL